MGTKDLSLDNGREGEVVEEVSKHFPDIIIFVLPDAFIIEAITLGDGP